MTFFMNVMILNFLISIICACYERVKGVQQIISYKQKAELNFECFQFYNMLGYMKKPFKIIAMSTTSENEEMKEGSNYDATSQKLIKYMKSENKGYMNSTKEQKRNLKEVVNSYEHLDHKIKNGFRVLEEKQQKTREMLISTMI